MRTTQILSLAFTIALACNMTAIASETFPVDRTINDRAGKSMDVTVLSSSGEQIRIRRKSDGKEFDVPLANLSVADRDWALSLLPAPEVKIDIKYRGPYPSKEILASQEASGLVLPPLGWDALETRIFLKDGRWLDGYVYDVKDNTFWFAAMDMVQRKGQLEDLATSSRLEIQQWRNRAIFAGSPSVSLQLNGENIHASVIASNEEHVTLLKESGEFIENVPIANLDFEGRQFIKQWQNGRWTPLETEWHMPPQFDMARPFYDNGLAFVRVNGMWGVIDRSGAFSVEPMYDDLVEIPNSTNLKVRKNGKWGLMAHGARLAVPTEWEDVGDLHQGMVAVRSDGKWGYVEDGGRLVIPCRWEEAWRFSTAGLAVVTLNGKRGFINRSGGVIVRPEWDGAITHAPEGIGAVRRGKGWALIDSSGNLLCDPIWNFKWQERRFELGYIPAWPMDRDRKSGFTLLGIDGKHDAKPKMQSDVVLAKQPGPMIGINFRYSFPSFESVPRFTLTDQSGEVLEISRLGKPSGGLSPFLIDGGMYGYANHNRVVLKPQWSLQSGRVDEFSQGLLLVKEQRDSPHVFIDLAGSVIVPEKSRSTNNYHYYKRKFEMGRISVSSYGKSWLCAEGKVWSDAQLAVNDSVGRSFPKHDGSSKTGLINADGQTILQAEWDEIQIRCERWIAMRKNNKWGIASHHGEVILKPEWDRIITNSYHLFPIVNGGRHGLADHTGRVMIAPQRRGLIELTQNGAAIQRSNEVTRVFWPDGTELENIAEKKLTYVDDYGPKLVFRKGTKGETEWWIADQATGNIWILEGAQKVYWNQSLVEHERIWIQDRETNRWHFCSIDGKRLGPEMSETPIEWFIDDGRAIVREQNASHVIDIHGKKITPTLWEDARSFRNGFAAVKKDGLWGFIDTSGKLRINHAYEDVGPFFIASNEIDAEGPLLASVKQSDRWGYINPKGEIVIPLIGMEQGKWRNYEMIHMPVMENDRRVMAYYDKQGNSVEWGKWPRPKITNPFAGEWTITRGEDGKFGLANENGTVALEQEWRVIMWVAPGVVAVRNRTSGGLFSPEKGWIFEESDQLRLLRDESGGFARDIFAHGLIKTEKPSKWGYARYLK